MSKVVAYLKGKKTNLVAATALVVVGLMVFGVLDQSTGTGILALLGPVALATLRDAIGSKE